MFSELRWRNYASFRTKEHEGLPAGYGLSLLEAGLISSKYGDSGFLIVINTNLTKLINPSDKWIQTKKSKFEID